MPMAVWFGRRFDHRPLFHLGMTMLRILGISLFALLLTGCVSSAKVESMTANASLSSGFDTALKRNISVEQVSGGGSADVLGGTKISNADFQSALRQSLDNNGLNASSGSVYSLRATLLDLQQPNIVINATVETSIAYSLVERRSGQEVWRDTVRTSYEIGFFDAFLASTMVRMATEGAARRNIETMLQHLATFRVASTR